ncbi:MAG: PepSY-like domain-containing protein [Bacteroides sp.]|nr:PepSY-like domain-containing protein [Roseburia sp.]MCM1346193.1 PepSY-like domain-containing protein [Bacteroides sp.]MCM1420670.1 PepSY-like domain-containing protein [Bacteroides sp.]
MKKLLVLFVCLFTMQAVVWADDDRPIKVEQMPQQAQQFIKKYFPKSSVSLAKMEVDLFSKSYEVIFTNGDKLEFDSKGAWTEVDCKYSAVPTEIVPAAIKTYVSQHHPDAKIVKIEKDTRDYEIELSNKWEIKFDKKFNVIDIDR